MGEYTPNETENPQTAESLRRKARRYNRASTVVGIGTIAAGLLIAGVGLYLVEPQLQRGPYDKAMTEIAFIGVGIGATATGGLFAKELRWQANALNRQSLVLSANAGAAHLQKLPEEAPAVSLLEQTTQEAPAVPDVIVLLPEEVATLPTSSFVPPSQLPGGRMPEW